MASIHLQTKQRIDKLNQRQQNTQNEEIKMGKTTAQYSSAQNVEKCAQENWITKTNKSIYTQPDEIARRRERKGETRP